MDRIICAVCAHEATEDDIKHEKCGYCGSERFAKVLPSLRENIPVDKETAAPIQNALYSTGQFTTDDCEVLAKGILMFLDDDELKIIRASDEQCFKEWEAKKQLRA